MTPLLQLRGLTVRYADQPPVLRDFDLTVGEGELIGVTGPSGVGKTTLGLAMVGLASWNGAHVSGTFRWRGQICPPAGLATLRGGDIGYLPQESRPALNPYRSCRSQVLEGLRAAQGGHGRPSRLERDRLAELFCAVGLTSDVARQFPHRLSGGMCQRVLLAAALAGRPSLLVADEPTASLDTLNRRRVLSLLAALRRDTGVAVLLITHDRRSVAEVCDRGISLAAPGTGSTDARGPIGEGVEQVADARR